LRLHLSVKRVVRLIGGDGCYERVETLPHRVRQLLERRGNCGVEYGRGLGLNGRERTGAAANFPQQKVQLVGDDMHFLHGEILRGPSEIELLGHIFNNEPSAEVPASRKSLLSAVVSTFR
jgi:hypothetical protein